MYPSKGSSAYGQQSYPSQPYGQIAGGGYAGSMTSGLESGSQLLLSTRSSIMSSPHEPEIGSLRIHSSHPSHYAGQYGAAYGSSLSSSQQGRSGYGSSVPESPKFGSSLTSTVEDYASTRSYGHKGDHYPLSKMSDYPFMDPQGSYNGRELHSESSKRYADSIGHGRQLQSEALDRIDQASLLHQQEMLKAQTLPTGSEMRRNEYLVSRGVSLAQGSQDVSMYNGRMDSMLTSSYTGQHAASILGAAPRRTVDDLLYAQGPSSTPYGVSLPPGRDYTGKGLHATSLDSGFSSIVGSKLDDRAGLLHRELDIREEERRRIREREREREREKERERQRERERERERDRERERQRERERERERERDRERRERERRDKERERERKRELQARHEQLPSRASKDRHGSLVKEEKSSHKDSPRHDTLRHHSPIKEIRRDYVCKVSSFCLVEDERDYLSTSKRYPNLFISPGFSRLVLNWPKKDLNLSLHTPVSFEHEFLELDDTLSQESTKGVDNDEKFKSISIVWNVKVILMSGVSSSALAEISSDRGSVDKISHYSNILRFALTRKDRSLVAIGGYWDAILDGGDPSTDDFSLIKTAIRCTKDMVQLDLQNCEHWNKFLEIHYDRIGQDGLFSHKEITVFFVPDLSRCLPSPDKWKSQWLAHKKIMVEREHERTLKREKFNEQKDLQGNQDHEKSQDTSAKDNDKKALKKEKEDKNESADPDYASNSTSPMTVNDEKIAVKKDSDQSSKALPLADEKLEKKKLMKKVSKAKPLVKKDSEESLPTGDSAGVNNAVKKKIAKKVSVVKSAKSEDEITEDTHIQNNIKSDIQLEQQKVQIKAETDVNASVLEPTVKTTGKKKVIKKIVKRKAIDTKKDSEKTLSNELENSKMESENAEILAAEVDKSGKEITPKAKPKVSHGKQDDTFNSGVEGSQSGMQDKVKDEKQKQMKDAKDDKKPGKEVKGKEKKNEKLEEPPRPGFILQTKWTKDSKIRSISLSLDSLMDYNDKDVDESSFEISLFAESLYEMLQYKMGCRILAFLEQFRRKVIDKRNFRKRQREENLVQGEKEVSQKRSKKGENEPMLENNLSKDEELNIMEHHADNTANKDDGGDYIGVVTSENEDDKTDEEDPEEDTEDVDFEAANQMESCQEVPNKDETKDVEMPNAAVIDTASSMENKITKDDGTLEEKKSVEGDTKIEEKIKEKVSNVDREVLQAFRFFDRNQVGYVKVEDLRLIIHNLGKFLSHRDVKDLVQSALLESNTGRDNRVFYKKLILSSDA